MLKLFARMYDGSHLRMDFVEYYQVQSFAIQSGAHDFLDLDGEIKGQPPFHAELVPAAFQVFS